MRITIVYNEPLKSRYDTVGESVAVASVVECAQTVKQALLSNGHEVALLGLRPPLTDAVNTIKQIQTDVIFNLFEGFDGKPETEWLVTKALEGLRLPLTGSSSKTLALCLNKARTKEVLARKGVPTAPFRLMSKDNFSIDDLSFPLIVKPLKEDASHGISEKSVVNNFTELKKQVSYVEDTYGGPVLVEQYLNGPEFNASVIGGRTSVVLEPTQIVFSETMPGPKILTYSAKWVPEGADYQESKPVCPAPVSSIMQDKIRGLALIAYRAIGSPPYARVDMRADFAGNLYVLEVNPNPDLTPGAGLELQANVSGIKYSSLVEKIVGMAMEKHLKPVVRVRGLKSTDVEKLATLTASTGFFYLEEVKVARELLEETVNNGERSGYFVSVADVDGEPQGYVCFGPTPLTCGTWDVYWIAVAPANQGIGIGSKLLAHTESQIKQRGGRLIMVETSSRDLYVPTRAFYESRGYKQAALVPDFYDMDDGKVIYGKSITT